MTNPLTPQQRYATIQAMIKDLETEKDTLNKQIVEEMAEKGETNNKTDFGEFLLAWKRTWEYSTETMFMEEQLKTAKKREEANGEAKVVKSTTYLKFLSKKREKDND